VIIVILKVIRENYRWPCHALTTYHSRNSGWKYSIDSNTRFRYSDSTNITSL